ncbi:hypothetical protein IQ07DRAFT_661668 [Pyrenochaeta sp. DS3sAY3a]|nr:hypothetical protein IQ07DRAFT_661668 [Pyrenochaeta sp. DS3sAY3a]
MLALLQRLTSPPTQTLRILQPTPSTVQYTVSTRSIPQTIPAILGHGLSILVRTAQEDQLLQLVERWDWKYLAPAALVLLTLVFRRGYTEESITLLRGLGVQTSTASSTYLLGPTTRFIPTTSIQDIFINEAFKGFEVRFYLAIVVEGEEEVLVVFPNLLPRRATLEVVWKGARACLWDYRGGKKQRNEVLDKVTVEDRVL